jgi:DNA polymerase elongation subunit (family B)
MAYRHVKYDHKRNIVHLWTWDKSGARVKKEIPFKPFLMVPSENGKFKSIDGKTLRKVEFKTISDREKYWERNENMQIYNCINVEQQFMLEVFGKVPIDTLVKHTLKTYVLDIEVYSPKEFPHAEESAHPINLITIHDNISDMFYTWGTDAYDPDTIAEHISDDVSKVSKDRVVYKRCNDETELLRRFVTFWKANTPDVLVTWNGLKFDVPYIMGRLDKLFGDTKKQQLSPIGQVTAKDTIDPKFQTMYKEYTISGVSHIDYMNLFRYFARNEVNSLKLDDVAKETLGISKLHYNGSLAQLSTDDWNKYVNYNIQDVNIIVLLDKSTNYLEVARYSACAGLCNIEKAMGKLAIVGGVIAKTSMERHDAYIPTNRPPEYADKIEGGYVKEVEAGIYHDVLSYDANSLYPSCIITLNISPETKCGRVYSSNNDTVNFTLKGHGEKAWKTEKFINFLKKNDIALSSAGILFTQKKVGILPEFVDYLYSQRKEAKNEMIKLSNSEDANKLAVKELITQLDTKQYLYKILFFLIRIVQGQLH